MKRLIPIVTTALVFLLSFTAVAHASAAVEPADGNLWQYLQPVYDAFANGHYLWAGSVSLVFAVGAARRYLVPRFGWMASDAGSAALVLLGSFGATLTATLAGNVEPTWQMVSTALKIAFMAAGGFSAAKKLVIEPYLAKLADKGPKWLHYPMEAILWLFKRVEATAAEQAVAAVKAINAPNVDVQVIVSTPAGTAVASSPATTSAPAPISVVTDIAVPRAVTPSTPVPSPVTPVKE